MKTRTNLHAGTAVEQCQAERDQWKTRAEQMDAIIKGTGSFGGSGGSWQGNNGGFGGTGGNWQGNNGGFGGSGGSWQNTSGGWVNGIWYPDRTGACG